MSDRMKCENCGKAGNRQMRRMCPEGWQYAEVKDDDVLSDDVRVFVVAVCGDECAKAIWKPGPGFLDPTQPPSSSQLDKALRDWARWYSAKRGRINIQVIKDETPTEEFSSLEQALFEALGCYVPDESV